MGREQPGFTLNDLLRIIDAGRTRNIDFNEVHLPQGAYNALRQDMKEHAGLELPESAKEEDLPLIVAGVRLIVWSSNRERTKTPGGHTRPG